MKGPTHATSAGIVRVRRVISQDICDPTLGKGPTHATSAIIVRVRRVISQDICEPTLGKGPTHATSARIVRVRRVISQDISDEGTVEAEAEFLPVHRDGAGGVTGVGGLLVTCF